MKKKINFKREKEFDTKTLFDNLRENDTNKSAQDISEHDKVSSDTKGSTNKDKSEHMTSVPVDFGSKKPTKIYEPRPLMPGDGMYEDILEQFASAPTKPKYWYEEFGDYWSCSCGHINKGDICKNCGLERKLLKSLFILHKPDSEPGKLNKRLRKTKEQVDREETLQAEKEKRRRKFENIRGDDLKVIPIDTVQPDEDPSFYECTASPATDQIDDHPKSGEDNQKDKPITEKTEESHTDNNMAAISKDVVKETTEHEKPNIPEGNDNDNLPMISSLQSSHENKKTAVQKKKLNKRLKIAIISVFCAILLAAACFAIYRYLAAPAMQYEEALKLMDSGKYEKAIEKFEALGNYKDSKEMIWECYVSIGDIQYENGEFSSAIETYNIALDLKSSDEVREKIRKCYIGIGDDYYENDEFENALSAYASAQEINDSENLQDKINKAKFAYVKAYQSERTDKVVQYMSELMAISYPGIREIYDEYYAWHVSIVANTSEDNTSEDMSAVSRKDTVYFHSTLSGGEPSEQIEVYYEVIWPNGSSQVYNLDQKWSSGSTITARFQYSIPLFGKEGKFTFKLYDRNTGKMLGSDSVTFKN